MFEIESEKLGKKLGRLLVYNVTQARSNFAGVLKEKDAKVVVTRHGRPTKILINYDEYLALLAQAANNEQAAEVQKLRESLALGEDVPSEATNTAAKPVPPKWVQREADQIVNSLIGMLHK